MKIVVAIIALFGILCLPKFAQAQDTTLRIDPGFVVPLNFPQASHFDPGFAGDLRFDFGMTRWLDTGPVIAGLTLPGENGGPSGELFAVGWQARIKRPHDLGEWNKLSSISPWIDGDWSVAQTGMLTRAATSIGVGVELPVNESRTIWEGPFLRYLDVVEDSHPRSYNQDFHAIIAGLTFEFGEKDKPKQVAQPQITERRYEEEQPAPKQEEEKPCPPPPPQVNPEPIEHTVQFAFDSAVLHGDQKAKMTGILKLLLSGNYTAEVDGYASSEGNLQYNIKLSQRRAQAVVDFFVSAGVERSNLTAIGKGISDPVATNDTEEGREQNRRAVVVQITLKRKGE